MWFYRYQNKHSIKGLVFVADIGVYIAWYEFQQCTTLVFIYMLLLPEGQTGEASERSKEPCMFGDLRAMKRKVLSLFYTNETGNVHIK